MSAETQRPHAHAPAPEHVSGPSEAGCVVLEIGPGAGAAIVLTPSELSGTEIEIRRAGRPWDGTHVAVRPRRGSGPNRFAAIFGSLPAGCYEFRPRGTSTAPTLVTDVAEASVAVVLWPDGGVGPPGEGLAVEHTV